MKKILYLSMLMILLLSACTVDVGVEGENGVSVDISPGESTVSDDGGQQQDSTNANFWTNPFFIAFIVALLIIVLVVILRRPNRPQ